MSKCCKYAKWFPHNWLCLKGLYVLSLVLFYLVAVDWIIKVIQIANYPGFTKDMMWVALKNYTLSAASLLFIFLTVAKVVKALRKIKQAVAPCCCDEKAEKEENK